MADQKHADLVQRLVKKTEQGTITWERTVDQNVFQASFASYSVKIKESRRYDIYNNDVECVSLAICDDEGNVIDEFTDEDFTPEVLQDAYRVMESLFAAARRKAFGVDAAIDSILGELDKAPF